MEIFVFFDFACFHPSSPDAQLTQLLIFLKARIAGLQLGASGVGDGVVEGESCHGTQSTYHAKCRRECSSGPGRPSIPGKLIVINQVTETEQGLADDHLSPLLLLLPPPPPPLLLFFLVFFLHLMLCFLMHPDGGKTASKQLKK